jgi:uncharacterized protein (TIGR04255 family)
VTDVPRLPSYASPPVVEVSLGISFRPLAKLEAPHIGLLWSRFRPQYSKAEQHPPLPSVQEDFEPIRTHNVQLQVRQTLPVPRCWFLNEAETDLVQVQQNRFIRNWRRIRESDAYPRYELLRNSFIRDVATFQEFLVAEELGELDIVQSEVTFVNHIEAGDVWDDHGEIDKVISLITPPSSIEFLPNPETAELTAQYVIHEGLKPVGRLHIGVQPAYRVSDSKPIVALELTARGAPQGEGIDGALRFLDLGHGWVVRGFTAVTTPQMHTKWGRDA